MPSETMRTIPTAEARPLMFRGALTGAAVAGDGPKDLVDPTLSIPGSRGPGEPPPVEEIVGLCKRGLQKVVIEGDLFAPPVDRKASIWLAFLRDLTACGVDLHWRRAADCPIPDHVFRHLPPPVGVNSEFRFGSLYWRLGPEFVTVKDSRGESVRLFILDDAESSDAFLRSVKGVDRADLPQEQRDLLLQEGLVADLGGWLLALPYRMRHWPVPFRAI